MAENIFACSVRVCYDVSTAEKKNAGNCSRGRKGFDGGSCCIGSEPGVHQPVSKVKLLLNIKANDNYALAA